MKANKTYKDSVFKNLFSDENRLRELYSALTGEEIDKDAGVTINTLEGVLFLDRMNDLSFSIGDKQIVVIEAQSSVCPNMPLRLLEYISRLYENIVPAKKKFGSTRLTIPRPDFYVLYNGPDEVPDKVKYALSDMFAEAKANETLELTCTMYNVNPGHNEDILKMSKSLTGYSELVSMIRVYLADGIKLEEAIKKGVEYCIEKDYDPEYYESHAGEVMSWLYGEYDREIDIEVNREEAREEEREEIARNLKSDGVSIEIIVRNTGLSAEAVAAL